jgi:phosphoribosylamine--glycine ligase
LRVLVVGGGGREHALVWRLARSESVDSVVAAPGNPGIAELAECHPLDANDAAAVGELSDEVAADLVIVGPEEPLVCGVVDAVEARGRRAFGPTAAGARLEGSKAWMKELLVGAGVPTAAHGAFTHDEEDAALDFLNTLDGLYVVKTSGLAAGKGVTVTESVAEARDAVRAFLSGEASRSRRRRTSSESATATPGRTPGAWARTRRCRSSGRGSSSRSWPPRCDRRCTRWRPTASRFGVSSTPPSC